MVSLAIYPNYYYPQQTYPQPIYSPQQSYIQKPLPKPIKTKIKPKNPTIKVEFSDSHPYLQQNIMVEVKLQSTENLTDLNIKINSSKNSILRPLNNYTISTLNKQKKKQFTTVFRYILTPFQGEIATIDKVVIKGLFLKNNQAFVSILKSPLTLSIKPIPINIKHWQPLYQLTLKSKIQNPEQVKKGEPIVYQTEIYAEGMTAKQIPPLLPFLKSNEYKIYLDTEVLDSGILHQNKHLWGRRSAVYTLVPHLAGKIIIPKVQFQWWDLTLDKQQVSTLPIRQVVIQGKSKTQHQLTPKNKDFLLSQWFFWLPAIIAVLLLLFYWGHAFGFLRSKIVFQLKQQLTLFFGKHNILQKIVQKYSPRRFRHRLRAYIGQVLPLEWKLWYCLQTINKEQDPETWGNALQILAVKHLGARSNSSMRQLAEIIAKKHPSASARKLSQLMLELNGSIYGKELITNFSFWKRQFKAEIKPHLFFFHREEKKNPLQFSNLNKSN